MTATTVLTARALLLDMDGTLVDSHAVVERIWRNWSDRHGLNADEVMKVVHGRQGYASMALLLPGRPMEQNHAENARMLAEETADVEGVVPILGAPEFLASLRGCRTRSSRRRTSRCPRCGWGRRGWSCRRFGSPRNPSVRASLIPRAS